MGDYNNPEDSFEISFEHKLVIKIFSSMSIVLSIISIGLIISNFTRLLIRKLFKWMILVFYLFAFMAVTSNVLSQAIVIYWLMYKK